MGGSKRSRDLNLEAQSVPRPQLGGPEASQGPQLGDPKRSKIPTWRPKTSPRPHLEDPRGPKRSKTPTWRPRATARPQLGRPKASQGPQLGSPKRSETLAWRPKASPRPNLEDPKHSEDPSLEAQASAKSLNRSQVRFLLKSEFAEPCLLRRLASTPQPGAASRCKPPTWRPQSFPRTPSWKPKALQDSKLEAQSLANAPS